LVVDRKPALVRVQPRHLDHRWRQVDRRHLRAAARERFGQQAAAAADVEHAALRQRHAARDIGDARRVERMQWLERAARIPEFMRQRIEFADFRINRRRRCRTAHACSISARTARRGRLVCYDFELNIQRAKTIRVTDIAREIVPVSLEEEMRKSYLDYAMSVIVGRALPDVRDGLKPVHRRVLHAMRELGNDYNRAYKKSARVVGDVIGKYHPHGDVAVYDTIVRMAQPFSMRYLLVDGQGNFGSVDGDSPAAMRYTEVRMSKLAGELLADIDKETVDFVPNYDESEHEPKVLPTRVPNLLVNGSSGIAVGMATNIPPHNLTEIINACLALLDDPAISLAGLMQHVPGPDFPTAGIINGAQEIA